MPNIKSAKKRVLVTNKKSERNQMRVSAMKTAIKKFDAALEAGDAAVIDAAYKNAIHLIDQAAAKGNLEKNTASRRKSLLTRKLNAKKA
ncbi:MAG: 30S ribosomal protein S20 [Clostridia bacterium]|nr:30S ribosomal protein S20 [Clostridia bacterium]